MIRYEDLLRLTNDYNRSLNLFISEQNLPYTWFIGIGPEGDDHVGKQDHVAVKAYGIHDYQSLLAEFKPFSTRIVEAKLNGRWIASARLLGKFAITSSLTTSDGAEIEDVEIMLARPEDQGNTPPIFDHSEIYTPDMLIPINSVLTKKGLHPLKEGNEAHEWVSVNFGPCTEEVKFSDKRLREINNEAVASGKAEIIYDTGL